MREPAAGARKSPFESPDQPRCELVKHFPAGDLEMTEWYESLDDDQWLKPDGTGEDEAATIYRALELNPESEVLDIPCGAGRVAFHLARRGVKIAGVDLRKTFLERANERFRSAGLSGEFILMDMRKIAFIDRFDGIMNWQGSFVYFGREEDFYFLRKPAGALKRKGNGGDVLALRPRRMRRYYH